MSDELKELKAAVENLVQVAKVLHTPLDTSQVEKCMSALESESSKVSPPVEHKFQPKNV